VEFYKDHPRRQAMLAIPVHPEPRTVAFDPPPPPEGLDCCECGPDRPCKNGGVWTRQHPGLVIADTDLIGDCNNARELFNLCAERGIDTILYLGVASNMCVCHRSFGLLNARRHGFRVVFVRDLVEAITANGLDPATKKADWNFTPAKGSARTERYLERHVAPSIESRQLIAAAGTSPQVGDARPHIVFVIADDEYKSEQTLPAFARENLTNDFRCTFCLARGNDPTHRNDVPGLDALYDADLLVLSMRRRALPVTQMDFLERYLRAGKPLVALRVCTVPFQVEPQQRPDGHALWRDFDQEVLGCQYRGYHPEARKTGTEVWAVVEARNHPVLRGLADTRFHSPMWIYRVNPLAPTTELLLRGRWSDQDAEEPVAWTNSKDGSRVFYTCLGHPDDFAIPAFRRLLANAVQWTVKPPVSAAADQAALRSLRVELPGQELNLIKESWPSIGCWFWTTREFAPEGYKDFLDKAEKHSAFRLLTTSIRANVEVTDPKVHDQIKLAAEYARAHDMAVVMDLDVRLARKAFLDKHPDELQEIVRLREVRLKESGDVEFLVETAGGGDHYTFRAPAYYPVASRLLRVYSYIREAGGITPASVVEITPRCKVVQADAKGVKLMIPCRAGDQGRTACVMVAHSVFTADVFAPHLIEFERAILRQYADVALAGACKDEWGFPGGMANARNLWFSRFMAEAYGQRRPGRDLARDLLLMSLGEMGRDGERAAAINHYMQMSWQRNAEVENGFYRAIKDVFGQQAMSATHPTWYPYPNENEVFKNGLDWWACQRDLAQTDEATPFCARTALAKKWRSPLWYNMYYDPALKSYEEDVWRHALGGGRMNFHPQYPGPWSTDPWSLAQSRVLQADARIRLLNTISTAPIDCPVAVVFGHPAALNWSGKGFADVGLAVSDGLWAEGFYADLIPSSEIVLGNLKVAGGGSLQYGQQRYAAAVLYHPQFEDAAVAEFFRKAAVTGKTALFRVGDWTLDFEGTAFEGAAALPPSMKPVAAAAAVQQTIAHLKALGHQPQTRCTMRGVAGFPPSMMPKPSGQCRLLDGTVMVASGEKEALGDPIQKTLYVNGHAVAFDAVGVAAVRLDQQGKVEAMAAGGLKSFRAGDMAVELPRRVDVALWRDAKGEWQGVLQGYDGPLPDALTRITRNWTRLAWPISLDRGAGQ
jgi:hypothetical protein